MGNIFDFINSFKIIEWLNNGISDKVDDWKDGFPDWAFLIKLLVMLITRTLVILVIVFTLIAIFFGWGIFWISLGGWIALELLYKLSKNI